MNRLIDTIVGFTTTGFAAGGAGTARTASKALVPFTTVGQPVFNYVKGENTDPDFIEVFTLGCESDQNTNIYQCEGPASGLFSSQWYKLIADSPTNLNGSSYLTVSPDNSKAVSASTKVYARKVSTGSHGLLGGTAPGGASSAHHTFDLSGHGGNISYTQKS